MPLPLAAAWALTLGLPAALGAGLLVTGAVPQAPPQERPLAQAGAALVVLPPALTPAPGPVPELQPVPRPLPRPTRSAAPSAAPPAAPPAAADAADAAAEATAVALDQAADPRPAPTDLEDVVRAGSPRPVVTPTTEGLCSGRGWEERRGRAALAALKVGPERTGFRVEFLGARSGQLGLTHLQERRIEIFVRPCGRQSDDLLRHVIGHELGHAYDTAHLTPASRRAWQLARGIPVTTPWYGCSGCADFATPAGDFAEVYAQWASGSSSNDSELAGDVPVAQLAPLARRFFGA